MKVTVYFSELKKVGERDATDRIDLEDVRKVEYAGQWVIIHLKRDKVAYPAHAVHRVWQEVK